MVVGRGPNGLAAAIVMARAGRSVLVLEAEDSLGGGTRSAQLTLPGYVHDVCSAVHTMALASPFFRSLPLQEHGLECSFFFVRRATRTLRSIADCIFARRPHRLGVGCMECAVITPLCAR
ncbi:MAG: NAD(P)-binding protein [Candidatus Sulfotelmatobacter sp.]